MADTLSGIVLAGGASRRMGISKALLPWGDSTLLEHVLATLEPVVDELLVVVDDARRFQIRRGRVIEDLVPGAHALGGLYTGLKAASCPRGFVCACDMPFLNPRLIRFLAEAADGHDLAIPGTAQGLQPLHAVYAKSALGVIEAQLRRRQWDLHTLITQVRANIITPNAIHALDPAERSFLNLNSPKEYRQAFDVARHFS